MIEVTVFVLWALITFTPRTTVWAVDRLIGKGKLPTRLAQQPAERLYLVSWIFHAALVAGMLLLTFAMYPAWWIVPPGSVMFGAAPMVMLLWAAYAVYQRIPDGVMTW